ncbi:putative prophage CP4-6 integrase [Operophtera brumata]|uniref:Putative prophage CP4-6 integrase n=1 Tax=Operophtera brumata TaxID=104452 RepID=A0A0L7L8K8_OPEBR|nr:putative prophage CP4-6 integrase [Operophtera brumata]
MYNPFKQVSDERYKIITARYAKFQESMSDDNLEPVKVFDPLSQKHVDELHLIREVSKELQKKKEEDINKAALVNLHEVVGQVSPSIDE